MNCCVEFSFLFGVFFFFVRNILVRFHSCQISFYYVNFCQCILKIQNSGAKPGTQDTQKSNKMQEQHEVGGEEAGGSRHITATMIK